MEAHSPAWKLFVNGFFSPLRAGRLLLEHRRLLRYAVLPFLVNCLAFGLALAILFGWVIPAIEPEGLSPAWAGETGRWVVSVFTWLISLSLFGVVILYGFSAVGLVIASPFNDILSEKVEEVCCGSTGHEDLGLRLLAGQILLSFFSSLKIVFWQGFFTLLALPFLLIPLLGFLPLFLVNAMFNGLGYMDIPLMRHFLRAPHRRAGLGGRRAEVLGFGVAMMALMLIPFANLIALPLGVTAATLLYGEIDWRSRLAAAGVTPPPGYIPPPPRPSSAA